MDKFNNRILPIVEESDYDTSRLSLILIIITIKIIT